MSDEQENKETCACDVCNAQARDLCICDPKERTKNIKQIIKEKVKKEEENLNAYNPTIIVSHKQWQDLLKLSEDDYKW